MRCIVLLFCTTVLSSGAAFAALPENASYKVTAEATAAAGGASSSAHYANSGVAGQGSPLGAATATGYVNLPGFLFAANATLDADGDLLANLFDNCWHVANVGQANFDLDPWGDACDPDDDNDTLADVWENRYRLNPLDAGDAGEDSDGDGRTNLAEALAGSDPTRVGALPPGYQLPQSIAPLQLPVGDGPLDGQRPLPDQGGGGAPQ